MVRALGRELLISFGRISIPTKKSRERRRVTLRATEQPINTGTAAGKAFLDMLGVFAEFETNLRKERQAYPVPERPFRGGQNIG